MTTPSTRPVAPLSRRKWLQRPRQRKRRSYEAPLGARTLRRADSGPDDAGEDGLAILKRLRAEKDMTPVIMLTARGEDVDRILGLELGADDYLGKPFNPRELLARIHAVLRRRPRQDAPGAPSMENEVVKFGDFELDLGTRVLKKNGEIVPLTTGEFAVLKAFARHPRQPLSRDKLMEMARGREYEAFDRSLDVQVSRLRKLLEPDPRSPAICRQSGDWDTSLSRTVTLNYASERSTDRLSNRPARACLRLEPSSEGNLIARGICQMAKLFLRLLFHLLTRGVRFGLDLSTQNTAAESLLAHVSPALRPALLFCHRLATKLSRTF